MFVDIQRLVFFHTCTRGGEYANNKGWHAFYGNCSEKSECLFGCPPWQIGRIIQMPPPLKFKLPSCGEKMSLFHDRPHRHEIAILRFVYRTPSYIRRIIRSISH